MTASLASELVGTWQMVSWTQRRGETVVLPMGESPVGTLLYTSDGVVSVNIMKSARDSMTTGDFVSADASEKASAFSGYLGYSGTYEVEEGKVVHLISCASYPNWVGDRQVRHFILKNGLLTLEAAPRIVNGLSVTATLIWRRRHG